MLSALPTPAEHLAQIVDLYRGLATTGPSGLEILGHAALLLHTGSSLGISQNRGARVLARRVRSVRLFAGSMMRSGRWCRWSLPTRTWPLPIGCSRMGAALRAGPNDSHRDDLLSHYRGDSPSHYHALDRHLLGLTDEASALGVDRQRSVEVAYYLGLQADVERRLLDAIGGYRVALETNEPTVYETQLLPTARRAGGRAARAPRAARASRAWQPCPPRPTPLVLTPPAGGSPRAVFVGPLTGAHVSAVQASAEG
jgi:hypothetical protein